MVDVTASRAATASTLSPRLRRLLDQARPPVAGEAAVDLIVSADSVRVGEQVDVVTAAWFPRDLRLQLRRPPTLQPPVDRRRVELSAGQRRRASRPRAASGAAGTTCSSPTKLSFRSCPARVVVPRATLKYSTPRRPPVLQPGGTLRARQQGGDPRGGRPPGGGTTRRLQRGDRNRPDARAAREPEGGAGGRRRDGGAGAERGGQHGAVAGTRSPMGSGSAGVQRQGRGAGRPQRWGGSAGRRRSGTSSCPTRRGPCHCRP